MHGRTIVSFSDLMLHDASSEEITSEVSTAVNTILSVTVVGASSIETSSVQMLLCISSSADGVIANCEGHLRGCGAQGDPALHMTFSL